MKTMKHRKSIVIALAAVMAVVIAVTGSTFAWFTATDGRKNHFETAKITDGTATLFEIFKSPDEWMPDQEVLKNVAAANSGANDILVRISFEEFLDKVDGFVKKSATPCTDAQLPVLFDSTPFTGADWDTAAAAGLTIDPAVTTALGSAISNLKVKTVVVNPGAPDEKTSYAFVFWYDVPTSNTYSTRIGAGAKQAGRADLYVEDVAGVPTLMINGTAQFSYYDGRVQSSSAWAAFDAPQISPAATVASPAAAAIGYSQLDATNKYLQLIFATTLTATPTANNWCYNPDDGFFYFIGVVAPGTISPYLLNSVKLDENAGSDYADMDYDLYVNLEAIQPIKNAVTATSGWGLTNTAILNALDAAGVYAVL